MINLSELAEHYYIVAQNLTAVANEHLYMAERLNRIADQLCEANIKGEDIDRHNRACPGTSQTS